MSENKEELDNNIENEEFTDENSSSAYNLPQTLNEESMHHLPGMYFRWYLDYASYANLNRAIPHITDGLKPVQRRVLHSMKRLEDGRYNKVANIVGHTMQFHPHGDASIYEALVNLGQKQILIDCQGNWGNILTGDGAAAARYIEARLSKFAIDAVFNPKTTAWRPSYDGRNEEPVALPVKFPLLLAQGSEGIGIGLNSKILPHNFNELIDASILYLKNEEFELFPDFFTGGMIDVSQYKDGERGGKVKIRAKISKLPDNKSLIISEIPYSVTTGSLIESITSANEKGKISIKKVDDNTAENVEIVIMLENKVSSDKTIDALYAFTQCELSYSPNCCVIDNNKPVFISVSQVLKRSADNTVKLLKLELEIQKQELQDQWQNLSLEKWFIENRIYKEKQYENSKSTDEALDFINTCLIAANLKLIREVRKDDLLKLLEIRMKRILKFNVDKANNDLIDIENEIKKVNYNLEHLIAFTIKWFKYLKEKYGKNYPRLTEIRNFENIEATKVVEANEKLYVNKNDGFIGTNLKRDDNVEFVQNCSDIDDIIVFLKKGKYKIVKISEKQFVGKDIEHVAVFKKNDLRTIYNAIYRDGKNGVYYIKRFAVNGITRDKEYDLTAGAADSKLIYFSANPNGEAEVIRVKLKPTSRRIKKMEWDCDFSEIMIKGRASRGNLLTKFPVSKITFRESVGSTLGGTNIWLDKDILRLNTDNRGEFLGEFFNEDLILVVTKNGDFYTTNFDLNNHFEEDYLKIEKFDSDKIWSAALYDAEQKNYYIKRFPMETSNKRTSFLGDNPKSTLKVLSDETFPCFQVIFGGKNSNREPLLIDVEQFIGEKSYKAKGKRISTYEIASITEVEPVPHPELDILDEEIDENFEENEVAENENKNETEIVETAQVIENQSKTNPDEPSKSIMIYDENDISQGSLF
ncbi:MAG: DNA gyrase/topoisomerase IV subunit A [Prevotellaceae bacterium]|jgi:topoisomerase-4 subunit A|nr:DNA gyrase/topoisomerase IV subunit A [Prevotellaceae bacterium]